MIISDQLSCINCSRKLTSLMNEQKVKMNKIQYVNLTHEGACYKNSTKSPAIAEEFACEKIGRDLLKNTHNTFLQTDECIFATEIISDGDTRGCYKLILEQEIILGPAVKGIAKHVPDIGHFVKCISNAFYKFKLTNKYSPVLECWSH